MSHKLFYGTCDWQDTKRAEEIYYNELPSDLNCHDVDKMLYSLDPEEDICARLLEHVGDAFYAKYGVKVEVEYMECDSYFKLSNETRKQIESLASKGAEMAKFILSH